MTLEFSEWVHFYQFCNQTQSPVKKVKNVERNWEVLVGGTKYAFLLNLHFPHIGYWLVCQKGKHLMKRLCTHCVYAILSLFPFICAHQLFVVWCSTPKLHISPSLINSIHQCLPTETMCSTHSTCSSFHSVSNSIQLDLILQSHFGYIYISSYNVFPNLNVRVTKFQCTK